MRCALKHWLLRHCVSPSQHTNRLVLSPKRLRPHQSLMLSKQAIRLVLILACSGAPGRCCQQSCFALRCESELAAVRLADKRSASQDARQSGYIIAGSRSFLVSPQKRSLAGSAFTGVYISTVLRSSLRGKIYCQRACALT